MTTITGTGESTMYLILRCYIENLSVRSKSEVDKDNL